MTTPWTGIEKRDDTKGAMSCGMECGVEVGSTNHFGDVGPIAIEKKVDLWQEFDFQTVGGAPVEQPKLAGGRHELALSYVARYGFVDRTRWVLARC